MKTATGLESPEIFTVTVENYLQAVEASEKPVLLQFWATWCVPCMLMKRSVAKAAEGFNGEVVVGLVNVEEQPELVKQHGVQGTPTFVLIQQGKSIATFSGMASANGLIKQVTQAVR